MNEKTVTTALKDDDLDAVTGGVGDISEVMKAREVVNKQNQTISTLMRGGSEAEALVNQMKESITDTEKPDNMQSTLQQQKIAIATQLAASSMTNENQGKLL